MLPTSRSKPKADLSKEKILLYGRPKIGKSTFASQWPDSLFLATEPGLAYLEVYQVAITDWSEFVETCTELVQGNHPFKTVVVDTIDNAYRFCNDYVCSKYGIKQPSDLPFGKGFALVNNEFMRILQRFASYGYGMIFLSHGKDKEMKTKAGDKYYISMPSLTDGVQKLVAGWVDIIAMADLEFDEKTQEIRRVIRTKTAREYVAGSRLELDDPIALDYGAFSEAYAKAFNKLEGRDGDLQ